MFRGRKKASLARFLGGVCFLGCGGYLRQDFKFAA
jgi:hypothetical protein